ncbi:hypothetical protein VaNZ11_005219 [Volvox africanus]|uniref:E3 ubiquitin-protein ligase CHFR n=1 Tax=Volvox africanus TaxID=51714 RepID=A0ABQ5RY53_9CHLO|nr:hypothetical protein VaNZ11_005219 [Volvox africanus]
MDPRRRVRERRARSAWGYLQLCREGDDRPAAPPISLIRDLILFGRGMEPSPKAVQSLTGTPSPFQWISTEDERVSRMHASIRAHWEPNRWRPLVSMEDYSRNGTFLNGVPLRPGHSIALSSGDRISLVLSVNPLAEVSYKYEEASLVALIAVDRSSSGLQQPHPARGSAAPSPPTRGQARDGADGRRNTVPSSLPLVATAASAPLVRPDRGSTAAVSSPPSRPPPPLVHPRSPDRRRLSRDKGNLNGGSSGANAAKSARRRPRCVPPTEPLRGSANGGNGGSGRRHVNGYASPGKYDSECDTDNAVLSPTSTPRRRRPSVLEFMTVSPMSSVADVEVPVVVTGAPGAAAAAVSGPHCSASTSAVNTTGMRDVFAAAAVEAAAALVVAATAQDAPLLSPGTSLPPGSSRSISEQLNPPGSGRTPPQPAASALGPDVRPLGQPGGHHPPPESSSLSPPSPSSTQVPRDEAFQKQPPARLHAAPSLAADTAGAITGRSRATTSPNPDSHASGGDAGSSTSRSLQPSKLLHTNTESSPPLAPAEPAAVAAERGSGALASVKQGPQQGLPSTAAATRGTDAPGAVAAKLAAALAAEPQKGHRRVPVGAAGSGSGAADADADAGHGANGNSSGSSDSGSLQQEFSFSTPLRPQTWAPPPPTPPPSFSGDNATAAAAAMYGYEGVESVGSNGGVVFSSGGSSNVKECVTRSQRNAGYPALLIKGNCSGGGAAAAAATRAAASGGRNHVRTNSSSSGEAMPVDDGPSFSWFTAPPRVPAFSGNSSSMSPDCSPESHNDIMMPNAELVLRDRQMSRRYTMYGESMETPSPYSLRSESLIGHLRHGQEIAAIPPGLADIGEATNGNRSAIVGMNPWIEGTSGSGFGAHSVDSSCPYMPYTPITQLGSYLDSHLSYSELGAPRNQHNAGFGGGSVCGSNCGLGGALSDGGGGEPQSGHGSSSRTTAHDLPGGCGHWPDADAGHASAIARTSYSWVGSSPAGCSSAATSAAALSAAHISPFTASDVSRYDNGASSSICRYGTVGLELQQRNQEHSTVAGAAVVVATKLPAPSLAQMGQESAEVRSAPLMSESEIHPNRQSVPQRVRSHSLDPSPTSCVRPMGHIPAPPMLTAGLAAAAAADPVVAQNRILPFQQQQEQQQRQRSREVPPLKLPASAAATPSPCFGRNSEGQPYDNSCSTSCVTEEPWGLEVDGNDYAGGTAKTRTPAAHWKSIPGDFPPPPDLAQLLASREPRAGFADPDADAAGESQRTSRYPGYSGSDALVCGLCGGCLQRAIAVQPCGHTYCGSCLSQRLSVVMAAGCKLGCPAGCAAFSKIAVNMPARRLEELMLGHISSDLADPYTPGGAEPYRQNPASATAAAAPAATTQPQRPHAAAGGPTGRPRGGGRTTSDPGLLNLGITAAVAAHTATAAAAAVVPAASPSAVATTPSGSRPAAAVAAGVGGGSPTDHHRHRGGSPTGGEAVSMPRLNRSHLYGTSSPAPAPPLPLPLPPQQEQEQQQGGHSPKSPSGGPSPTSCVAGDYPADLYGTGSGRDNGDDEMHRRRHLRNGTASNDDVEYDMDIPDLCPLPDEILPLPAERLHVRQAELFLMRLREVMELRPEPEPGEAAERCLTLLCPLTRLASTQPGARDALSAMGALQGCLLVLEQQLRMQQRQHQHQHRFVQQQGLRGHPPQPASCDTDVELQPPQSSPRNGHRRRLCCPDTSSITNVNGLQGTPGSVDGSGSCGGGAAAATAAALISSGEMCQGRRGPSFTENPAESACNDAQDQILISQAATATATGAATAAAAAAANVDQIRQSLTVQRAACGLIAVLLSGLEPEGGCQQSNQWSLARMGGVEVLLKVLGHAACEVAAADEAEAPPALAGKVSGEAAAQDAASGGGGGGGTAEAAVGEDVCGIWRVGSDERWQWRRRQLKEEAEQLAAASLTVLRLVVHGNTMTQAHVTCDGVAAVLGVLRDMPRCDGVLAAGMQLLVELARGDDVTHTAIRQRLMEEGALQLAVAAIWGGNSRSASGRGHSKAFKSSSTNAAISAAAHRGHGGGPVLAASLTALGTLLAAPMPDVMGKVAVSELRRLQALSRLRSCLKDLELELQTAAAVKTGRRGGRSRKQPPSEPEVALLAAGRRVEQQLVKILTAKSWWCWGRGGSDGNVREDGGVDGVRGLSWRLFVAAGAGFAVGASFTAAVVVTLLY